MANVLPPEVIRRWNREAAGRLALATSVMTVFATLVCALALLPPYIAARAERMAREELLKPLQQEEPQDNGQVSGRALKDTLASARRRLAELAEFNEPQPLGDVIARAAERRPTGVRVNAFHYTRGEDGSTLTIVGKAGNAEKIKEYADALRGREPFSKVNVPLTSLVNVDGSFSISATGKF